MTAGKTPATNACCPAHLQPRAKPLQNHTKPFAKPKPYTNLLHRHPAGFGLSFFLLLMQVFCVPVALFFCFFLLSLYISIHFTPASGFLPSSPQCRLACFPRTLSAMAVHATCSVPCCGRNGHTCGIRFMPCPSMASCVQSTQN